MDNIDDLYADFLYSLKDYSECDSEPITTDLVVLYNFFDNLLKTFIRKLSLTSFNSKNHRYINQCISNIKELDFFKDEDLLIAINEYNNHKFNDSSLDDCMCEIRLAKGEIDYNKFPFIISQLHKLCSILNFDDDDDIETAKIIDDYWYLQPYICYFFATKAINEMSALIANKKENEKKTKSNPKSLIIKNANKIPKVVALLEKDFIDINSLNSFCEFLNTSKTDPKIVWLKYPNSLFYFFNVLKQKQIIKITRWGILNDGFNAYSKKTDDPYSFKDAKKSFSKGVPAKEIKDKLDMIIAEFCNQNFNPS